VSGIRGVTHHNGRTFDWNPRHDERSRGYAVRSLVSDLPTKAIWWVGGAVSDQGSEGACVGHACTGEYLASPARGRLPKGVDPGLAASQLAFEVYKAAQRIDPWPGENYSGTAVNAGMKVGRERGWWDSYHWAFGLDDVKRALLLGPVVIGVPWLDGMYSTQGRYAEIVPSGPVVGGHAILITGWSPKYGNLGETFRLRNSWGPGYGKGGNGYLRAANLAALLADEGEAAVPTGRRLGNAVLLAA
jgi:hypothetical protein